LNRTTLTRIAMTTAGIMLAHQLGYRLPDNAAYGIWHWDKLWKELGFSPGPR